MATEKTRMDMGQTSTKNAELKNDIEQYQPGDISTQNIKYSIHSCEYTRLGATLWREQTDKAPKPVI